MRKLIYLFCLCVLVACSSALHRENSDKALNKDTSGAVVTSAQANQQEEADRNARLIKAITMTVYDKGFTRMGTQNLTRFDISITNKSDQPITAVKGRFVVANIFGDHLKDYKLKFDDTNIKPGQTIKIIRFWDYDKTAKEDLKIKTTPISKLKINYEPEMVIYADGSTLQ